jgi:hypothetical protein
MADLNFQDFSTVQSNLQPLPSTIAAAATIVPRAKLTFLTGTTSVVTITPPVTGYHELTLCFTNASPGVFSTAGNIQIAYQPIQNRPIDLCYDPSSNKYWVKAVV